MADDPTLEDAGKFAEIGEQVAEGIANFLLKSDTGKAAAAWVVDIVGQGLGVAMAAMSPVGIGLAKGIADSEDLVAPALSHLAAAAVSDMFGQDVPASTFAQKRNRGGRTDTARALGDGFMRVIAGADGPAEPGDEAAKKYLGVVINMALEGWYQGWMFELMSSLVPYFDVGKIESFAQLDDTVAQSLGLGRLSRRVIAPLLDATVVAPLRWKVNKDRRPELLSASAAIETYLAGRWTFDKLNEELSRQGYDPDRILALINNAAKRLTVAELLHLNYRGAIGEVDIVGRVQALGYDEKTAAELLSIERNKLRDKWLDPIVDAAVAAYVAREIGDLELRELVENAAPTHAEAQFIVTAAQARRQLRVRQLSSSDERRLVLKQIRAVVDFRRALEREGYEQDAIAALELELRQELDDRQDLEAAKAAAAAARLAEQETAAAAAAARAAELAARKAFPTLVEFRRGYVRGHITRDQFVAAIVREKVAITPEDLALLLVDADEARGEWLAQQERAAAAAATPPDPTLSVSTLEAAVVAGILTLPEFDARLAQAGYDDDERRVLTALLGARLEDRDEARRRRDEAASGAAKIDVSLPAFERAVRLGLRSRADYAALLDQVGMSDVARALILDLLDAQLAEDAAARTSREVRDPIAKAAGLSLAQRRRAVIAGVLSRDAYHAALLEARWPVDDQLLELALVDAELAEAEAARARRDQVAAGLPDAMLTLAQVERAVRLALLPPDALRDYLRARGYEEADVETIVSLAIAGVPDVRAGQVLEPKVAAAIAGKGAALDDLQTAVKRGLRTLEQYGAELATRGVRADDVALLVQLLSEEVALDVDGLRARITKALEKAEGAPPLSEIDAAFAAGELDVAGVRDVLVMFAVPRDAAIVYARLLLSVGLEA